VAVSAITTFTTPFMVKMATPFSEFLERKLPRKWLKKIARYSTNTQAIKSATTWQVVLRTTMLQIVIHTIIITAIILLSSKFVLPLVESSKFGNAIAALITIIIISPFLWALALRRVAVKEVEILRQERKYRGPIMMMVLFRIGLATFYIGFLLNIFFSPLVAFFALIIAVSVYVFFPKKLHHQYIRIENHFLQNFNNREILKTNRRYANLTPWDGHMSTFIIAKESNIAGSTLKELRLREEMGINIAFIKRGEIMVKIPTKNERLFPGDEICVIGTDAQVKEFKTYLHQHEFEAPKNIEKTEITLQQLELNKEELIGKSISESRIREKANGMVVGIERNGKRLLNPESDLILQKNDILWVVGDKKRMNKFFKE
jgi:CPA2 family monovalent cation:H+ antiporter-2